MAGAGKLFLAETEAPGRGLWRRLCRTSSRCFVFAATDRWQGAALSALRLSGNGRPLLRELAAAPQPAVPSLRECWPAAKAELQQRVLRRAAAREARC